MRSIELKKLTKTINGVKILDGINLTIPGGKFFALLGPSGCGKTTLLRLIAGLDASDSGKIILGKNDITHVPVNKRPINVVFQNYALFPHLNVFDNVAYSLNFKKKLPKSIIEQKVFKILETFHLQDHIYKFPSQLSGGQQQRVALARAIVNEPDVLLLDEPLAALDFKLREKILVELIELQDKLKITFIYVTHDQMEALTVADQMAIMNHGGYIEQIGRPKEIYEFPISSFVAKFVGTTNILTGTLHSLHDNPTIAIEGLGKFHLSITEVKPWMSEGCPLTMSLRPEKILISKKNVPNFSNCLKGTVHSIVYHGRSTQYNILVKEGLKLQVFEQNEEHFHQDVIDYDQEVFLYWQKENVVILEK